MSLRPYAVSMSIFVTDGKAIVAVRGEEYLWDTCYMAVIELVPNGSQSWGSIVRSPCHCHVTWQSMFWFLLLASCRQNQRSPASSFLGTRDVANRRGLYLTTAADFSTDSLPTVPIFRRACRRPISLSYIICPLTTTTTTTTTKFLAASTFPSTITYRRRLQTSLAETQSIPLL